MEVENLLILVAAGLFAGLLAGLFGIGGGTVIVPILVSLNYTPLQSVATSTFAIIITAVSGTIQNWRIGAINFRKVVFLGLPAVLTAPLGKYLAEILPPRLLLTAFGIFLIINIFLANLRRRLSSKAFNSNSSNTNLLVARIFTGGAAGLLAGLFGIGGGAIMVPLQMLLLQESIKTAIQTSLAVIVITAISACVAHAVDGNVLFLVGFILGAGGLIGAQITTRFLPKLPERFVSGAFYTFLALLAIYMFWQAWNYSA